MTTESSGSGQQRTTKVTAPDIDWRWDAVEYVERWHEPLYEMVARHVPRGAQVLELGGGGSHTLAALGARHGCDIVAVDLDWAGLYASRRFADLEGSRASLVRGDAFSVPLPDGSFDVVYSLGLMEHFSVDNARSLLVEHRRVCRPGGKVLVSVPNGLNFPHTIRKVVLGSRYPYFPERNYTPGSLKRLCRRAGLTVTGEDGCLPLHGLEMARYGWIPSAALARTGAVRWFEGAASKQVRSLSGFTTMIVCDAGPTATTTS